MEGITDADYLDANRVCKDFEIKKLGEYHDLYVQSKKFLSATGLAWQAVLRKTRVKLYLLTDINMLLMLKKGIRGEICLFIYLYAKSNNKYMRDYDENKESSHLQYWEVNNLYGWAMSQKPLLNNFEWVGDTSQFNEDFIKNYNEESDGGYFF